MGSGISIGWSVLYKRSTTPRYSPNVCFAAAWFIARGNQHGGLISKMKEKEKNNLLRMTISDPELVQKIRESGIERLGPDELNSLGIEVKNGHMSLGDASQTDLEGTSRIRIKTIADKNSAPSPLRRGFVRFIAILTVLLIVLSTIGIIFCKMNPQLDLTNKDVCFLSLFLVVGLGLCLSEFRIASAAKKYLTECVQGKCISHDVSRQSSRFTKRSIFEYTYRDNVYRSCESVFANKGYAKIGEVRELMISPENPRCIYDPIAGRVRKIGLIMIGMFFIVITVIVLFACING